MSISKDKQKVLAARTAVDTLINEGKIFSGMKIGLGTGSTAMPAVKRVAERIADGTLKDIKAVATSFQTSLACEEYGIPVYTLNDKAIGGRLDLAIDGADEIGPGNSLIKGGGAALLREKITEYNADTLIIVADESKVVKSHGTGFALPVEVIPEARLPVTQALEQLGARPRLREGVRKAGPVITDNGNMILDCLWEKPVNPAEMEDKIDAITGVVECGFFTKVRPRAFVAHSDGSVEEKKFKAVIFDLDGTLLDTLEDLTDSCNQALGQLGYPEHTIDEVRQFVGNGLGVMMEKALPDGKANPDYNKALDSMREIYSHNYQNKTKAYSGVLDLIEKLKDRGVKMAIVSNKPDVQVKELAALYFKSIPQEAAIGENEAAGIRRKPFPDSVYTALKALGEDKDNAVYIGDSDVDMATARNAGLPCISVSWGFRTREFLQEKGAATIVNKPDEIPSLPGF